MKTLADFKKRIAKGVKIHTIYHQASKGRDERGVIILGDEDKGIREVNIVQATQFTLLTPRSDGSIVDSWMKYPKASECTIIDENTIMITCQEWRQGKDLKQIPLLTYKFV